MCSSLKVRTAPAPDESCRKIQKTLSAIVIIALWKVTLCKRLKEPGKQEPLDGLWTSSPASRLSRSPAQSLLFLMFQMLDIIFVTIYSLEIRMHHNQCDDHHNKAAVLEMMHLQKMCVHKAAAKAVSEYCTSRSIRPNGRYKMR